MEMYFALLHSLPELPTQEVCDSTGVDVKSVVGLGFAATCSLAVVDSQGHPVTASPSRGQLWTATNCIVSHMNFFLGGWDAHPEILTAVGVLRYLIGLY